ncbi:MAG: helix-turn-helix transcriptional regulator [Elusimicrobia bacterium]|nr:helix-turn-helix transcriptional regulator [Elusimicrobiota bacterium]
MGKSVHSKEYQALLSKLKRARLAAGLTQEEVAQRLRQPQSYVSKVESGERRLDAVELKALARVYGKLTSYFVD